MPVNFIIRITKTAISKCCLLCVELRLPEQRWATRWPPSRKPWGVDSRRAREENDVMVEVTGWEQPQEREVTWNGQQCIEHFDHCVVDVGTPTPAVTPAPGFTVTSSGP